MSDLNDLLHKMKTLSSKREDIDEELEHVEHFIHGEIIKGIEKHLTKPIIDAFAPCHEYDACSDENLSNSYLDNGCAKCTRCYLLKLVKDPHELPLGYQIKLRVVGVE